jgi:hypothetical protein
VAAVPSDQPVTTTFVALNRYLATGPITHDVFSIETKETRVLEKPSIAGLAGWLRQRRTTRLTNEFRNTLTTAVAVPTS